MPWVALVRFSRPLRVFVHESRDAQDRTSCLRGKDGPVAYWKQAALQLAQSQDSSIPTIGLGKQERSAAPWLGLHPNPPFVTLDHPPAYRQTQACTGDTSAVKPSERLEDLFLVFRID